MKFSPEEIRKNIKEAKPFRQNSVAKDYEGIDINWFLFLSKINEDGNGKYDITFNTKKDRTGEMVCCDSIDLSVYPQFRNMAAGEPVYIEGKIDKIKTLWITLRNCVFNFSTDPELPTTDNPPVKIEPPAIINTINITNSNELKPTLTNIQKNNEPENVRSKKEKRWWQDPSNIISLVIGLVTIGFSAYSLVPRQDNISKEKFEPTQSQIIQETKLSDSKFRKLDTLETGKPIQELPDNTFFYGTAFGIVIHLTTPQYQGLEGSNKRLEGYTFELQKMNGEIYLVGFVSAETLSNLGGSSKEKPGSALIFPNKISIADKSILIPFRSITAIGERKIEYQELEIRALEADVISFTENPEVH